VLEFPIPTVSIMNALPVIFEETICPHALLCYPFLNVGAWALTNSK
jgi:hypothetical protein